MWTTACGNSEEVQIPDEAGNPEDLLQFRDFFVFTCCSLGTSRGPLTRARCGIVHQNKARASLQPDRRLQHCEAEAGESLQVQASPARASQETLSQPPSPKGMSVYQTHAWYPWKPEEGIISPGIGVTDNCKPTHDC